MGASAFRCQIENVCGLVVYLLKLEVQGGENHVVDAAYVSPWEYSSVVDLTRLGVRM